MKSIADFPELKTRAAKWFSEKWHIDENAYLESMDECIIKHFPVPQWYVLTENDRIIAGLGVIENDFHPRTDLTTNVCAVYVEKDKRNQGIAGRMLKFVCEEMHKRNIDTLYLVTNHTGFYERYGWEFYNNVRCDGEEFDSRIYIHKY